MVVHIIMQCAYTRIHVTSYFGLTIVTSHIITLCHDVKWFAESQSFSVWTKTTGEHHTAVLVDSKYCSSDSYPDSLIPLNLLSVSYLIYPFSVSVWFLAGNPFYFCVSLGCWIATSQVKLKPKPLMQLNLRSNYFPFSHIQTYTWNIST